jgi:hypothetical protein
MSAAASNLGYEPQEALRFFWERRPKSADVRCFGI